MNVKNFLVSRLSVEYFSIDVWYKLDSFFIGYPIITLEKECCCLRIEFSKINRRFSYPEDVDNLSSYYSGLEILN